MGLLADICDAVESYNRSVEEQVQRVRSDAKTAKETLSRWQQIRSTIPIETTPTGLNLPRLALPHVDEPGEVVRYLMGEGLPGEFPFVNSAYRELYLDANHGGNGEGKTNGKSNGHGPFRGRTVVKPVADGDPRINRLGL